MLLPLNQHQIKQPQHLAISVYLDNFSLWVNRALCWYSLSKSLVGQFSPLILLMKHYSSSVMIGDSSCRIRLSISCANTRMLLIVTQTVNSHLRLLKKSGSMRKNISNNNSLKENNDCQ
jgi:hypothetical protein